MFEHILAYYNHRARNQITMASGLHGWERWDCFTEAERCNHMYTRTLQLQVACELITS